MKAFRLLSLGAVAAAFAAACSDLPTSPSAGLTADQLTGTWTLTSVQPAGGEPRPVPAGATYTLTFADGRLSTRADCNTCNGPFVLSGQTMTAGPAMACTRAACSTMAFENLYTSILSGDSTATLTDGVLMLLSSRGVLRFTR